MRIHVVSDVHGSTAALARAADGADALVCLGDLVLYLDYEDSSQGIFADLFGAEGTARFVELRTAGRYAEARAWAAGLWEDVIDREGVDRRTLMDGRVRAQYAEMFEAMPQPAWITSSKAGRSRSGPSCPKPGEAQ